MIQRWKRTFYERIAGEISAMTRYYDAVIQFDPPPSDTGYLLECIDAPPHESQEDAFPNPQLALPCALGKND